MITTLSKMKLSDFIELLCGNSYVLKDSENDKDEDIMKMANELIYIYQGIVNPSGLETILLEKEERLKIQYKLSMCKVLKILIGISAWDEVGGILKSLGYNDNSKQDIVKRIDRMKAEAEYLKHRLDDNRKETKKRTPDEIRASFDKEIAFLMTYFKMNIDVNIVSAGVYANMLRQADIEIKRKIARK